jgi:hypothetical protein
VGAEPENNKRKSRVWRRLAALAVLLALTLFILPAAFRYVILTSYGAERLKHDIENWAGANLSEPLTMGKLEVDLLGRVIVSNVRLGDRKEPLFESRKILVLLSVTHFLGKDYWHPANLVRHIRLIEPKIHVIRLPGGVYNYLPLIKGSSGMAGGKLPEFKVSMSGGELLFEDRNSAAPYPIRYIHVRDFHGLLNLRRERRLILNLDSADGGLCKRVQLKLKYDMRSGWRMNAEFDAVPLDMVKVFLPKTGFDIDGTADRLHFHAEAAFTKIGHPPVFSWGGETRLDGARFTMPGGKWNADDVSANVKFSERMFVFEDLDAGFAGGRLGGYGSVVDYSNPAALLSLNFESLNARNLATASFGNELSKIGGSLSGTALVSVAEGSLQATASVAGADMYYNGFNLGKLNGQVSYANGRIDAGLSISGASGEIETIGKASTAPGGGIGSYFFTVDFSGVAVPDILAAASANFQQRTEGTVGGEVVLRSGKPGGSPEIFGSVQGQKLAAYGVENASATVSFKYSGGNLDLENLVAEAGEELLVADGTVGGNGALDVKIDAAVGKVSTALAIAGRNDIAGDGDIKLSGRVGGTVEHPSFRGDIEGNNLAISSMSADRVTGGITYEKDVLTLSDLYLYSGRDRHELDGWIDLGNRKLDLDMKVSGASLAGLAGLVRDALHIQTRFPEDLGGIVSADASISGTFDDPAAEMKITATDVTMYGEKIDSANLNLSYEKFLKVLNARIQAAGGEITFSGNADPDALDLVFEGKSLMAEKITHFKQYRLEGALAASGIVTGTLKSPEAGAIFSSDKLFFRGTDFKISEGKISYREEGLIELEKMTASRGDENYYFRGRYDLAASSLDLNATLENAGLKTLTGFLPFKLPEGTKGLLQGKCRLTYTDRLSGVVSLSGADLSVGTYPVDEMKLQGSFDGLQFNISEFEAHNEISTVQAGGMIDMEKKTSSRLNISAFGIELSRLSDMGLIYLPAGGSRKPVGGMADIVVDLIGKEGSQTMAGSITAYNPSVMNVEFDRAQGLFDFDGDVISLTNLQLLKGEDRLTVSAKLPVRDSKKNVFDISIAARNLDLDILNPLLKSAGAQLGGSATLENFGIGGDYNKPEWRGSILLDSVSFSHHDLKPALTGIHGKMRFNDANTLEAETLEGEFGGSSVKLHASAGFNKFYPDNLSLSMENAENLYVEYKNIYHGMIDLANIEVKSDLKKIEIDGRGGQPPSVKLHNGTFTITYLAAHAPSAAAIPVSIGEAALSFQAGDGFIVQNSGKNLYMEPSGKIQISGPLSNPEMKGWLTATRGHLILYAVSFKVTDEAIIGFNTIKGVGIVPMFYMVGSTRSQGTDITMYVSGPMIDINMYPAYRELCGGGKTVGGTIQSTDGMEGITVPTIAIGPGGEITVPVCPRYKFEAYENNDISSTQLTEQQILQKIGLVDIASGKTDTGEALQEMAFSALSPIFGSFVERGIDLENFAVDLDPNKDVLVKLEKRIGNNFYVRYERLFSQEVEEQLDVRYEFRKRSFLKWGINQDNQTDYQVEYRLGF